MRCCLALYQWVKASKPTFIYHRLAQYLPHDPLPLREIPKKMGFKAWNQQPQVRSCRASPFLQGNKPGKLYIHDQFNPQKKSNALTSNISQQHNVQMDLSEHLGENPE